MKTTAKINEMEMKLTKLRTSRMQSQLFEKINKIGKL